VSESYGSKVTPVGPLDKGEIYKAVFIYVFTIVFTTSLLEIDAQLSSLHSRTLKA
jgi:hypothetical protein